MGWIAFFAGIVGFLVVYIPQFRVPAQFEPYLAVAVLAGLDAVVGGARGIQEGVFKANVFLTGFIMTVIIAVLLTAFGDSINAPIWTATVFVFTWRILNNVSYMRRYWLDHEQIQIPRIPALPRSGRRPHGSAEDGDKPPK